MNEEKNLEKKDMKGKAIPLIIGLVLGLIIGLVIMYYVKPSRALVKVNGKAVTEHNVYDKLQKFYASDVLTMVLEDVDNIILSKKYKEDDKMKEEIKEEADKYIESYTNYYGGDQEDFLKAVGFDNYEEFTKYLGLEYKRNLYYFDYLEEVIGENKIKEYYDANNYGKIGTKHILVATSDSMSEEAAEKMAKEIITKLNEGANFDELANEYKEKNSDAIISEDLGELDFTSPIEASFIEGLKAMEDNSYSKEPVKTSYGYHIIYRKDKKDFSLEEARNAIIKVLAGEVEAKTQTEKLFELRKEAGLKFNDDKIKEEYNKETEKYNNAE